MLVDVALTAFRRTSLASRFSEWVAFTDGRRHEKEALEKAANAWMHRRIRGAIATWYTYARKRALLRDSMLHLLDVRRVLPWHALAVWIGVYRCSLLLVWLCRVEPTLEHCGASRPCVNMQTRAWHTARAWRRLARTCC